MCCLNAINPLPSASAAAAVRLIAVRADLMLEALQMVLAQTRTIRRRVVIDDRSRLPGRFFGRFATSATSELTRAL
jgi:hypothetical protein